MHWILVFVFSSIISKFIIVLTTGNIFSLTGAFFSCSHPPSKPRVDIIHDYGNLKLHMWPLSAAHCIWTCGLGAFGPPFSRWVCVNRHRQPALCRLCSCRELCGTFPHQRAAWCPWRPACWEVSSTVVRPSPLVMQGVERGPWIHSLLTWIRSLVNSQCLYLSSSVKCDQFFFSASTVL